MTDEHGSGQYLEERLVAIEAEQSIASQERKELHELLEEQSEQLDRVITILDTITRVRNFVAWMSPVFGVAGLIIGMRL